MPAERPVEPGPTPGTSASSQSLGERIIKASFLVGLAHLCLKFLGLVQATVAGNYIDKAVFDVVYVFAFEGAIYSAYLIGEEVIGPSFLPVFMGEKDEHGEKPAWQFANVVLTVQTIVLFVAILLMVCFPDLIITRLTYWTPEKDPETYAIARDTLVWLAPSLLCLSLGSTTYMLLNGYKQFFLAAFGDASWKFCVIVALIVGMGIFRLDYRALVFGLLAGSVAKLLTHLLGLLRQLRFLRPSLLWKQPAIRAMVLLMLPLLAGILVAKVRDFYNNVTVLSYLDEAGLMQANSFGRKLFLGISWLVPYAVSIAMFPFFCELVDKQDKEKLGDLMTDSSRMILAFFIPAAAMIAVLSEPIAIVLFARGEVDLGAARLAGLSNACYSLVLPAFALEYILMQGYFANRKMISVTLIGMVFSIFSVIVSYVFVVRMGMTGARALAGVALGYTISRTLKTITLVVVLKRTVPLFPMLPTLLFLGRTLVLAAAVGAAGWFGGQLIAGALGDAGKVGLMAQLAGANAIGGAVFFGLAWVLRLREPFDLIRWGLEKVKGKRG